MHTTTKGPTHEYAGPHNRSPGLERPKTSSNFSACRRPSTTRQYQNTTAADNPGGAAQPCHMRPGLPKRSTAPRPCCFTRPSSVLACQKAALASGTEQGGAPPNVPCPMHSKYQEEQGRPCCRCCMPHTRRSRNLTGSHSSQLRAAPSDRPAAGNYNCHAVVKAPTGQLHCVQPHAPDSRCHGTLTCTFTWAHCFCHRGKHN